VTILVLNFTAIIVVISSHHLLLSAVHIAAVHNRMNKLINWDLRLILLFLGYNRNIIIIDLPEGPTCQSSVGQ